MSSFKTDNGVLKVMAVMELPEDYEENTRNKLIEKECPKMLLVIFNFVFLPVVPDLMQKLDSAFASKSGSKAYPRTLLLRGKSILLKLII